MQVDTLKFEQDVGLQTDDEYTGQDLSTQTDPNAWLNIWIQEISDQLSSIELNMISDSQNLISLLEEMHSIDEELDSNLQRIEQSEHPEKEISGKLSNLQSDLYSKRQDLLAGQCWENIVEELIREKDEEKIRKLLEILPKGAPFSKKLKEALKSKPIQTSLSPETVMMCQISDQFFKISIHISYQVLKFPFIKYNSKVL